MSQLTPEEHRFPCTTCGSDLRYSPQAETLACDHCGATAAIETPSPNVIAAALKEFDFERAIRSDDWPDAVMEETRVVSCDSCGAKVELGGSDQAGECPFCASPVVTDTGVHRHLKPAALLPFAIEEKSARQAMTDWLGRLWFAPNGLKEYARKGRRMQGIYVPYWTYDSDTRSAYRGQRGDDYWTTETRRVDGETKQVRVKKTRWRNVSGQVARQFDDVLVLASESLPRDYTDALEPWDLKSLAPYLPHYLAGFRAEGYQIQLEPGFAIARQKMDAVIARDVRQDIGGDHQRVSDVDTRVSNVTFKHILLPVWLAAYKYRGKSYRFVVNGRSGEVKGERPWSPTKIAIAVVLGLIVIGGLLWFNAQG